MGIDDEIREQEEIHQTAIAHLVAVETSLERLYAEKRLADGIHERLQEEGVNVQITQSGGQTRVVLIKGGVTVACIARSISGALLGAHTALRGDTAHVG